MAAATGQVGRRSGMMSAASAAGAAAPRTPAGIPAADRARSSGSGNPASSPCCSSSSRSTAPCSPGSSAAPSITVHAGQHHDLRAARARRDDGRDHPQRRPVDRLGARPVRLRRRRPVRQVHGIPIPVVVRSSASRSALACGLVNGAMVTLGRVPSLVVTLATLYIVRGIDILIVGGNEVVAPTLPHGFIQIARGQLLGVPYLAIGVAVVIGIGAYYLRSFRSGRELYAIGSNPEAAAAGRHPGRPAGLHRVRRSAARSPAWPACSGPRSTRRRLHRRAPATSSR